MGASYNGHLDIVRTLLEGRVNVNDKNNGWSRKLLNSQTPKLFGERLDAINIFRARKLPSLLFFWNEF